MLYGAFLNFVLAEKKQIKEPGRILDAASPLWGDGGQSINHTSNLSIAPLMPDFLSIAYNDLNALF
ncbi:MAG TPA: hypothetical protein VK870_06365 [Ignavibacteriaceae bacterium]|nr:hypothetical protein [Ignavibacteriaceae bacterium]